MALVPWPGGAKIVANPFQMQYAQTVATSPFTFRRTITTYDGLRWRGQAVLDAAVPIAERRAKRGEIARFLSRLGDRRHWTEVPHGRPVPDFAPVQLTDQDIEGDLLGVDVPAAIAGLEPGHWVRIGFRTYEVHAVNGTAVSLFPGVIGLARSGTQAQITPTLEPSASIRAIMTPGQATPTPWSGQQQGPGVLSWDEIPA